MPAEESRRRVNRTLGQKLVRGEHRQPEEQHKGLYYHYAYTLVYPRYGLTSLRCTYRFAREQTLFNRGVASAPCRNVCMRGPPHRRKRGRGGKGFHAAGACRYGGSFCGHVRVVVPGVVKVFVVRFARA